MMFQSKRRPTTAPRFDESMSWRQQDTPDQLALRQLRHHTKNALQRIMIQVADCPGLARDPAGRALVADLERRIQLSARLSDALFGLTHAPAPLGMRLDELGQSMVELMSDGDQVIALTTRTVGACPATLDDVLVRIAHELVGNAVKHGMMMRLVGRIEIAVDAGLHGVAMVITDDGWGPCVGARGDGVGQGADPGQEQVFGQGPGRGEGLQIAHLLAAQHGGTLMLQREHCKTLATVNLPWPGAAPAVGRPS